MWIYGQMNQIFASDLDFKYWKYRSNSIKCVPIPAKGEALGKVSSYYVGTMAF